MQLAKADRFSRGTLMIQRDPDQACGQDHILECKTPPARRPTKLLATPTFLININRDQTPSHSHRLSYTRMKGSPQASAIRWGREQQMSSPFTSTYASLAPPAATSALGDSNDAWRVVLRVFNIQTHVYGVL